jgi:hypothetical protein
MTAMKTGMIGMGLLMGIACGEDAKTAKPTHPVGTANQYGATSAPSNLLDFDPNTMTDADLQNFVGQLQSRDQAETQELGLLQAMNRDLCDRLQRLRTECAASIRLLADGSEKILGCQGNFADNTSVINKIEVRLAAAGSFILVGNKTFGTKPFGAGANQVVFASTGDATARPPRFMDLSSLRIASAAGAAMPAMESMGFELVLNESSIFTNKDLVAADDAGGKYYRINPANILDIQKQPACTVEIAEIQSIRDKVMAAMSVQAAPVVQQAGGQTQPAVGAQTQQAVGTQAPVK